MRVLACCHSSHRTNRRLQPTYRSLLLRSRLQAGVIFCSISEAVKEYPDLVRKYMGSVVSWRGGRMWVPCRRGEWVLRGPRL